MTNAVLGRTSIAVTIVAVTALVPALFILLASKNPVDAYVALFSYSLGTSNGFLEVVSQAIPLILVGLGISVAFKAGVFNIGGEGQIISGAILAFAFAPLLGALPPPIGLLAFLALGFVGGGLMGMLVAWLRNRFNANEIIVTIILNYIAVQALSWLVRGPLQEKARILPWSDLLASSLVLPNLIPGSRVHFGLLVAIAAVLILWVVLRYSTFGYKLSVVGENPHAARYAGIAEHKIVVLAMLISGGLAGLAGAAQISGIYQRLQDDFAGGYGQVAIAVALMARLSPPYVMLTAGLFSILTVGAGALQRDAGIPFPIVRIIEGVIIFGFLCYTAFSERRGRA